MQKPELRMYKARGIALELNVYPVRLDLTDVRCRTAKNEGVPVAIDSNAHAAHDYDNLFCGIGQARRDWLEKADVLNTRPLPQLPAWLRHEERR